MPKNKDATRNALLNPHANVPRAVLIENRIWETGQGKRIRFEDMEDSHVVSVFHRRVEVCVGYALRRLQYTKHQEAIAVADAVSTTVQSGIAYALTQDDVGKAMHHELYERGLLPSMPEIPTENVRVPPDMGP